MAIDDEARHLVGLIGHDGLREKQRQGLVGERHAGCDVLLGAGGGDAGELVAGPQRRRLRHEILQVAENMDPLADGLPIAHDGGRSSPPPKSARR
jgi:hypothetical protein